MPVMTAIEEKSSRQLKSDSWNIALLLVLYGFQGIFRGFFFAIPILLQNRKISYQEQALFSAVSLIGTFRILWAPIIDTKYAIKFGKRKSWLVPCQFAIGFTLLISSFYIDEWLGSENGEKKPVIIPLVILCLICNFLFAVEDITTDGWALTMLKRENVGFQATCNMVGIRVGWLMGYSAFILLNSSKFCNSWLRKEPKSRGLLLMSEYMFFWSVALIFCNIAVMLFKKDNSTEVVDEKGVKIKLWQSYKLLWKIFRLKSITTLCYVLMVCKVGLGPNMAVKSLKLLDVGLSREEMVMISIPLVLVQSILPFIFTKYFSGVRSLDKCIQALLLMIPISILFSILVYLTPILKSNNKLTTLFYTFYITFHCAEVMVMFLYQISFLSFAARIGDPKFGGTYMTLINTVSELGMRWPGTLSLALKEPLTIRNFCDKEMKTECPEIIDGYYIEVFLGILFTIFWLWLGGKRIMLKLQNLPESAWRIIKKSDSEAIPVEMGDVRENSLL